MFWTAVASTAVTSDTLEPSAGLASAAPTYQQQHTKPPRVFNSSWELSNAAFKVRRHSQQQQQLQKQQQELEKKQELQQQRQQPQPVEKREPNKKKVSPKSESKILKAFTSCKCTQNELN
ncbi:GH18983 [Drosophila grimshawi]|uniref:GH18983 n=2 Tax=Drosophila grimshawi TaxID=7222 RepID=B4JHL3_DROGR|nr:GH18983 [Drosophila grimshawi]